MIQKLKKIILEQIEEQEKIQVLRNVYRYWGNTFLKWMKKDVVEELLRKNNIKFDMSDFIKVSADDTYVIPKIFIKDSNAWNEHIEKIIRGYNILHQFSSNIENEIKNLFYVDFPYLYVPFGEQPINERELNLKLTNFKNPIKLKKFLIKNGYLTKKEKKLVQSKYFIERFNGIILQGKNSQNIERIKELFSKVKNKYGVNISSKYLRRLRIGNLGNGTAAMFIPKMKTMILTDKHLDYSNLNEIIHEYVHAVDLKEDLESHFEDKYTFIIDKMIEDGKFTRESLILGAFPRLTQGEIYGGKYDSYLRTFGYPTTYCLKNTKEFVAVTMEDFFEKEPLNFELKSICQMIKNKYFLT